MSSPIRLAIAGVGNCASSLIQGITYYRDAQPDDIVPGLMHVELGGYHVRDIVPVAAFDVDQDKVGTDLGKAMFAGLNNTIRFAEVGEVGVTVQRGPTLDGLGKYYREVIEESPAAPVDVAQALRDARADVLVSYLPVGSEQAQRHYAQACLDAGVAFVNAIPVFIASDPEWARRFRAAGVPIVGDDLKSQGGSTIVHRILTRLFEDRGLALDHTYQLNFGGNMDFKNMLERQRLESKKISKTQAVTSQLEDNVLDADDVHVGPSDHVPWLKDRKWAYIRMEGRNFGDVPLNLELKLEVWDSPNSAGVIIDAVRCAKLALDRGLGGPPLGPSAYFMDALPGGDRSPLTSPAVEPRVGVLGAEGTFVKAGVEEKVERVADDRPGWDAQVRHDLTPVERRPDRVELLAFSEAGDAFHELVHAAGQGGGLPGVAGRAVGPLELVQLVEQRPGVSHVAAHRPVGPPQRVGVDAEVQVDELGDVLDDLVAVPQRPQSFLGHAGSDHLVVVEADTARPDRAGLGLADVVEQRGEPHRRMRRFGGGGYGAG